MTERQREETQTGPPEEASEEPEEVERGSEGEDLARDAEPVTYVAAEPLRDLGLKVVLSWKGARASIGVSAEGCDPVFHFIQEEGTDGAPLLDLDIIIGRIPAAVTDAIEQWVQAKQRPAYKPPTPPPTAPRPAPARPVPALPQQKPKEGVTRPTLF